MSKRTKHIVSKIDELSRLYNLKVNLTTYDANYDKIFEYGSHEGFTLQKLN